MTPSSRSLRLPLQLVSLLLLSGCYGIPMTQSYRASTSELSRSMREKQMELNWVGHPYEELIQALGAPRMLMNIPAYRPWKASVAVYEGRDLDSDCIDAFAVAYDSKPMIYDYFCR